MGRKKQYNREELLDKAVSIFLKNGFHATNTDELADEFEINKKSLYAEFDSKLNLFQCTLEHYEKSFLTLILNPIEKQNADIDGIKEVFQSLVKYGEKDLRGLGCLLCNTSSDRGSLDPCIGLIIDKYFERIQKGFHNALSNSKQNFKKSKKDSIETISSFLTTTLIGTTTSIRAEAPVDQIRRTVQFINEYLDSLK
jgi:TetR/AcrR family transcriptional regulator, transcriptional repressor for nem operon